MLLEKRIPFKYWFNLIKWEIITVTLFSVIVYFLSSKFDKLTVPIVIPGFLGTSIALILSFKISQAYDRWWEARKLWGSIVNSSRTLVLQLIKFSDNQSADTIKKIAYHQIAWCYALAYSLRNQKNNDHLKTFISEEEFESISHFTNLPLGILQLHNENLKLIYDSNHIKEYPYSQIDTTFTRLIDSMGGAERIKKTIFPKTYRITLRFFIYLFLGILSLALSDLYSYSEIPLLILISIPFLLLERISVNMQDPFENKPSDTPMLTICRTIEVNIKQILKEDDTLPVDNSSEFYLL